VFSDAEKDIILRSWRLVVPIAETAADLFYRRLFELKPEYRSLFGEDMTTQKRKLVRMLAFIVRAMEWREEQWREDVDATEDLMLVVLALGKRHTDLYKIPNESYAIVGEALVWTLEQGLGDAFTPPTREIWIKLYTLLASTMQMGAATAIFPTDVGVTEAAAEDALMRQQAAAGIDDARLGFTEDAR
jgi:hemoglobin-like flavoprotein